MAIDSAAKRQSSMLDPGAIPYLPDGSISVNDQLLMLEFYNFDPIIIPDALGVFEDALFGDAFEPIF